MNLIEITHPAGALDDTMRSEIAQQIITGVFDTGEMPAETARRARRMTHVFFREAQGWTTGNGLWERGTPPPFLVTLTVPEAWRSEMSHYCIALVHAALTRHDSRQGFSREGGDVWINVIGVPDGSIGLNGRATDAHGVVNYMTEEYRATASQPTDLPEGVVIDPICGMRVHLGPKAITLDHDGAILGFCAAGCRTAYARNEGLAVPS